ncbi:MarR family transcriptional regulator [Candidatus Bathyarchaeota archaeon]|nr:MarR family transcriptional regulator [Candidatus Bathyarchaeota archaeon]
MNKRLIHFSKYDIALFIDEHGKTRWTQLLKRFVENDSEKHISRQRLSDYLKDLVDEGLVKKTVDVPAMMFRMYWRAYPIYIVPNNRRKKIQEIRNKKKIYEFVDLADPKKIARLQEEIEKIEKNQSEE